MAEFGAVSTFLKLRSTVTELGMVLVRIQAIPMLLVNTSISVSHSWLWVHEKKFLAATLI